MILQPIANWCYIYSIFGSAKYIKSGIIMYWCTGYITIFSTKFEVEHSCVVAGLIVTVFNELLSKVDIMFVPSKSIELSQKYFDDWYWVFLFTEG